MKRAVWLRDWRRFTEQASYALQYTERRGTLLARLRKLAVLAAKGPRGGGELFRIRCDRGAQIALAMGFPRQTAEAIRSMDEHWDGGGYPDGLRKDAIPIESRIINLAQVAEIFFETGGPALALETVARRSGRWFDPELVRVFTKIATPPGFWYALRAENLIATVTALQPSPSSVAADPETLERIALAFAWVIDAKSPYTYEHSEGVSSIASRIGERLGFGTEQVARLRQMALLHDIGKLAVPNRILDKPGPLTDQEFAIVREHPRHTVEILSRVPIFSELADEAGIPSRADGRTRLSPRRSGGHALRRGARAHRRGRDRGAWIGSSVSERHAARRRRAGAARHPRHGALSARRRSRARRAQRAHTAAALDPLALQSRLSSSSTIRAS